MTWLIVAGWTVAVLASALWSARLLHGAMFEAAAYEVRSSFKKDVLYRSWASSHGGVYVPATARTPPNPYLAHFAERDVVTPSGRRLTLMNPAYMTREVHELQARTAGTEGHITSLDPVRPENAPDPWEADALRAFARGQTESLSREQFRGEPHVRFMSPLITEPSCLSCHAGKGHRVGEIRGGISASVPLAPYLALARERAWHVAGVHLGLWALGALGILFAGRQVRRRLDQQLASAVERDRLVQELQAALANVKSLSGLLPICASCKKIRDDQGYWSQVESYVMKHSEARFTHGICPECIARDFPDVR